MGLDNAALLDEPAHVLLVGTVEQRGGDGQFVGKFLFEVVPDLDSYLLVGRLGDQICGEELRVRLVLY